MISNDVVLSAMRTTEIPVMDLDLDGRLSNLLDDVFDYNYIDLDAISPDDEYYSELVDLVNSEYDGRQEFMDQVLRLAPSYLQDALDEYNISAKVDPSSFKWVSRYHWLPDIQFTLSIDGFWLANKLVELSQIPDFVSFIDNCALAVFTEDLPTSFDQAVKLCQGRDAEQWARAVIEYIVEQDDSEIARDITDDMIDFIEGNSEYTRFSSYEIW